MKPSARTKHPHASQPARARATPTTDPRLPAIAVALGLATLGLYARVRGFPFIDSFDDGAYVTGNPHVTGGLTPANVGWAFTAFTAGNWHPLTLLSHMLDCQLFGVVAGPAHTVNVLLHAANVVLLFLGLAALTGATWRSAFAAGLFAFHPIHVESVAWIAERKDVLSTLFLLLTIGAYARYARTRRALDYALTMASLGLGLMAKPMLVTLPFALLLLDVWPLARVRTAGEAKHARTATPPARLPLEKAPMLVLVLVSIVLTLRAQAAVGAVAGTTHVPAGLRLGNAVLAYLSYLGKLFAPVGLACMYPLPRAIPAAEAFLAMVVLAAISAAAILVRRRAPYALVGWLWYLGTLVPVIGIVQVGNQAMADRYTYVPFIGLTVAAVWSLAALAEAARWPRAVLAAASVAVLLACAFGAWRQLGYWSDPALLFRRCLDVTTDNGVAHNNYGLELFKRGRTAEAITEFQAALAIDPRHASAWSNLGLAYERAGRSDDAVHALEQGLAVSSRDSKLHYNLALFLSEQRRYAEAFPHFEEVLQRAPENRDAHRYYSMALGDYGAALAGAGHAAEARPYLERALAEDPGNDDARRALAGAGAGSARAAGK
jgi:tetratricopeptide (TPR) repeat protein